jgi:hypothetical protein
MENVGHSAVGPAAIRASIIAISFTDEMNLTFGCVCVLSSNSKLINDERTFCCLAGFPGRFHRSADCLTLDFGPTSAKSICRRKNKEGKKKTCGNEMAGNKTTTVRKRKSDIRLPERDSPLGESISLL